MVTQANKAAIRRARTARMILLAAALIGAASLTPLPGAAQGGPVVIHAEGGGTATFDDGRVPNTTPFGVSVNVKGDGTAAGHWMCLIPNIVVVSGHIDGGVLNSDGSVTGSGVADIVFISGPHVAAVPIVVTVWAGGPGVGRFLFEIPSLGVADFETVKTGRITIQTQ